MDEIRGPAGRSIWQRLSNVQDNILANYLKTEHPQTVALILSKVKPEHSARVLSMLPEDFATDVMLRFYNSTPSPKKQSIRSRAHCARTSSPASRNPAGATRTT